MGGGPGGDFTSVTIEEEMKQSYLAYAMSVIVSRALPDVRDGLKPVHRRILYAAKTEGYDWNRAYRKSARIVGDVMGQYHPHGDQAIYDAMVRMAQDFSMREELIDGQGNFGSMDGDPPAAMRYTEARLTRLASEALLEDIDKDTVDFQPNYDESTSEPTVLPARYPNLLVNGAGGIAVGMATNIPPHNLGDVLEACCAYVDNPDISLMDLIEIVQAPDFPTGGLIVGRSGILKAYTEGRGSILMRGRTSFEPSEEDAQRIVIEDVPYQVNKARMIERIAEVVREKQVEGISALRDESDRQGLRVVVELKRDADARVVLNQLYRFTSLQTSFGVNMLAIDGGRPKQMTLKDVIVAFVEFREEVIRRRTAYELGKARERMIVLAGLIVAVDNIDEMIALIRAAPDPVAAREEMMARDWPAQRAEPYISLIEDPRISVPQEGPRAGTTRLTEEQARAILELRLQRLTALERDRIGEELQSLADKVREYLQILESRPHLLALLRGELVDIKERFGQEGRRTGIEDSEFEHDIEDLIPREEMVVTVTHAGYVKRVPLSTYRAQKRGGKGRSGMATREEDFVSRLFVCDTHTPVLFFSSRGMAYKQKVYRLPLGTPQARGKPFVNLLPLEEGETISAYLPLPEDEETWGQLFAVFVTSAGTVRRNRLSDFTSVKANGKIAMKLDEGTRADRRAGLQRKRRHPAGHGRRQGDPLPRHRRARLRRPRFRRRAGHQAAGRRPGHLAVDPEPSGNRGGGARRLPALGRRAAPRARRNGRRGGRAGGGGRRPGEPRRPRRPRRRCGCRVERGPPGRAGRGRAVPADHRHRRLRQAHQRLRVPHRRARRAGHRQHRPGPAEGQRAGAGRRHLPDRAGRPDHAGHRRRAADPLADPRRAHRQPLDPRRAAVPRRRGRACGLGRPHRRP